VAAIRSRAADGEIFAKKSHLALVSSLTFTFQFHHTNCARSNLRTRHCINRNGLVIGSRLIIQEPQKLAFTPVLSTRRTMESTGK
jgi:hypothetical protein